VSNGGKWQLRGRAKRRKHTFDVRSSGKKYKHCCLEKDRAAELAPAVRLRVAVQAQKAHRAAQRKNYQDELLESQAALQEARALDATSNAVVDLVHAGRLDEAEQAARELLARCPEVHDG